MSSYFSILKAKIIFNAIALIYGILDPLVRFFFRASAQKIHSEINLTGLSALDVGCGPGAWGALLIEQGAKDVQGIDFAHAMVQVARRLRGKRMPIQYGDAEKMQHIKAGSFDIVTASYVMHGFKTETRLAILQEMKRVAQKYVIINDYGPKKTNWIMLFLEILEGSDYFHFYKNFSKEFLSIFPNAKIIEINGSTTVYLASVDS